MKHIIILVVNKSMMMLEPCSYSLDEYQDIVFKNVVCELPPDVLNIIKELEQLIIQSLTNVASCNETGEKFTKKTFETTPFSKYIEKKNRFMKHEKKPIISIDNIDDWNSGKTFKIAPKIVKEGTEKLLNDIRVSLNKLSNKNMETQQEQIMQNISMILEETTNKEEDIKKIAKTIFEIAISNKFYSELYADLYKNLITKFDTVFKEQLGDLLDNYKASINNINFVDPNTDYDGYCGYTKTNDVRKAITAFIVNLVKKKILQEEEITEIIIYLEGLVFKYSEEQNRTNELEEIIENLFILITQIESVLNNSEFWLDKIIPNIHELSKLRKTDSTKYASMTNRATFKLMDIIDKLN
jgi:hypothetical protein